MKRFSILSALIVAGLFAALTSCEKDEQNEPQRAGAAAISGQLTANLNETDFQRQAVPEGTGITFVIDGADLQRNPQPGYDYEDVAVNVSVDADGMYMVSIPAVQNSVTATVIFDDFEFDATVITTDDDGFQQVVTERKTFTRANASVSVVDGQVLVRDYTYSTGVGTFVPSAIIKGVVEAQFTDNFGDAVGVAIGTAGSDYPPNEFFSSVSVEGGTGTGLILNYSTNMDGEVNEILIAATGSNYTVGDIIPLPGGSDDDNLATAVITAVNPYMEPVPEDVVLTFTAGGNPFKVATNPSGEYFAKLPATAAIATIQGIDFETTSVYFEGGEFVTGPKIYSFNNVGNQVLDEGSITELDLSYSRSN